MIIRKGIPWVAIVVTSASTVSAQATVPDEPAVRTPATGAASSSRTATSGSESIRAAAREGRSISISGSTSTDNTRTGATNGPVPEFHTVERGDTLWDITGSYFQNPWRWPAVWGMNPQITNPHWIFPNDQVRLLSPQLVALRPTQVISGSGVAPTQAQPQRVAPHTIFLRDEGWVDRSEADAAGTIVGSPEDQMLLSQGDHAYVEFRNRTPHIGEEYTVYQSAQAATGGDRSVGHVVRVLGSAVVESWDARRHQATVRITEALDGIERGERLAAIPRRLDVVAPVRNGSDVHASIVATVHPRRLVGANMVVFINRGSDDHVERGNRFFVVRRGDAWRQSLGTTASRYTGAGLDRDGDGNADSPPGGVGSDSTMPEEIVGELTITDVRPRSSTAVVTSSVVEVEIGDRAEMRQGY